MIENSTQLPRFDIVKYEKNLKGNPNYEGFWENSDTYVKQYHVIKEGYVEEAYTKEIVQNYIEEYIKNNKLKDVNSFDTKGQILSSKHYFGNVEIGIWKYYENDKNVRSENKDEGYKFDINGVLKFGKTKGVDLFKTGEVQKIKHQNKTAWKIVWNTGKIAKDGETYLFKEIILDGDTGIELSSKEYYFNPLVR